MTLPQVWLRGETEAGLGLRRTVQGPGRKLADRNVVQELVLGHHLCDTAKHCLLGEQEVVSPRC